MFLLQDSTKSLNVELGIAACNDERCVRDTCELPQLNTRSKGACSDLRSMESLPADTIADVTR